MTIRCAWCGDILGALIPVTAHETTDGICPACFDEQVAELETLHRMRPAADVEVGLEAARRVG